ncbi:head GIN domain-containing protein [Erythrobacter sp. QSSC1-22B]|uniref:head GIN domain-containing protein n=1 Tax=Erythrobacter sp. QSSC1-22B TaxID=1860125 RepID=UPI000A78FB43|nr:head GIN domain-containing protein [Erythrobacter sp. QSSC1-22B]
MFFRVFKRVAPAVAMAMGAFTAGCDGTQMRFGGSDGVRLAELDTSGTAPTGVVLASPDTLIVSQGQTLDIAVSGDPAAIEAMRFNIEDGALGIMREHDSRDIDGRATVRVTMPSLNSIVLAGSGTVEAASLTGDADVTIAGSGTVRTAQVAAGDFTMTVAGSGNYEASGSAETLELSLVGSGRSDMADLTVGSADVTIAGSGAAEFASDGTVEASIIGSGEVTVIGRATCTINAVGSGKLNCRETTTASAARDGPSAGSGERSQEKN